MHTVRRRSLHHKHVFRRLHDRKRFIKRQRVTRTALVALRRKHRHAAKITHRVRELLNTGRAVAVVITHQDMHGFQREKQSENGSVQEARPKDVPSGTDCVSDAQMTVLSESASFRLGSARSRTIAHTVGR